MQQALGHPWLAQDASTPAPLLSSVVIERLRSFTRTTRLERLLLNVAANQLTNKEIDRLADMFRALDADRDGCASLLAPPEFWQQIADSLCKGQGVHAAFLKASNLLDCTTTGTIARCCHGSRRGAIAVG